MKIEIELPNGAGFEIDLRMSYIPGRPAYLDGRPEDCYPAEPAEAEVLSIQGYVSILQAVYVACWACNCPMTTEAMEQLAVNTELAACERRLEDEDTDYL